MLIGDEMPDGYNLSTLAKELERTPSWVSDRLNELRSEILLNSGHFLPLTDSEFDALRQSIKVYGVQVPVLVGEHQFIDGRHRWLVSMELGLTEIPAKFVFGLTVQQEHDIAVAVNTARRHLNRKQKESIIRAELKRDWARSSRLIAAVCGVSYPTVESVRAKMRFESDYEPTTAEVEEVRGEVEEVFHPPPKESDVRLSVRGHPRPGYIRREAQPPKPPHAILGCPTCGVVHNLYNSHGEWRLELA